MFAKDFEKIIAVSSQLNDDKKEFIWNKEFLLDKVVRIRFFLTIEVKQEAHMPHRSPKQQCFIIKKLELNHEICNIDLLQLQ